MLEQNIISLIPQRAPFVMVDRLLSSDEQGAKTSLSISSGNIFVEKGRFTEPGLVENIAQTAAARIGYICRSENKPVPVGYIGAVQNLQIHSLPEEGTDIETEIVIKNHVFNVTVIAGTVRAKDTVIAECEMKIFITQS